MNILRQLSVILLISLIGEGLSLLIPLPVPASIYGIVILFLCLLTGLVRVESIRGTSRFLVGIMPVLFVPAGVGLMESLGLLRASLAAYVTITLVSTFAVMAVSGRVTQAVLRRGQAQREARHE